MNDPTTPPSSDADSRPDAGPRDDAGSEPSPRELWRLEQQRRIDREHRRSQRPHLGWDRTTRRARPGQRGRTRPRRRRRPTLADILGVVAVAALSGWVLQAQLSRLEVVATLEVNPAVAFAVSGGVALVGAVLDRRVLMGWAVVALVTTVGRRIVRGVTFESLVGTGWPLLVGLVAMLLASGVAMVDRRGRVAFGPVVGAASASLSLQCLASLPTSEWPTVGALVAGATVLAAGYAVVVRLRPAWLFD